MSLLITNTPVSSLLRPITTWLTIHQFNLQPLSSNLAQLLQIHIEQFQDRNIRPKTLLPPIAQLDSDKRVYSHIRKRHPAIYHLHPIPVGS